MSRNEIFLAADIGGTKTDMALYAAAADGPHLIHGERLANRKARNVAELVNRFLAGDTHQPRNAVFAVAGPVRDGRVRMTNLGWLLDSDALAKRFSLNRVILINDLEALALAAVHLPPSDLVTVNRGEADPVGHVAVLAPGTGLGEALLIRRQSRWLPVASEGGHTAFAPADDEQIALLRYLLAQGREKVSVEDVCSGRAVPELYRFCRQESAIPAPLPDTGEEEQTPAIVAAALAARQEHNREHAALRAMRLFIDILAGEAADLALTTLATGGVYIGGGLPPRLLPFFEPRAFMACFARGVYREMLARIPIRIITCPDAALRGAALHGYQQFRPAGEP